jgi:hypothetical protein
MKTGFKKELVDWLDVFTAHSIEEIEARPDVTDADKKRAKSEYGNVQFADAKNKKYPLDAEHIHAAISYFGMEKNFGKYSEAERKTIAGRIARAAKKHGVEISPEWKAKHGLK